MKNCYFDQETAAIVDVNYLNGGGYVVNRVCTPARYRGQGLARKLMAEMLADADSEGITLYLDINPYGPMTFAQLQDWYERLGFEVQDFEFRQYSFRRLPRIREG